jgi:myo-inositol-1(or 4)-monophosphatase
MDLNNISLPIESIIRKTGDLVLSYFQKPTSYREKDAGELVTEADLASERYLTEQLTKLLPGSSVIGEELGSNKGSNDYCWVIDPLDGTTNFVHQLPYFCISVALTCKGEPIFGTVYQPLIKEYFYAQRGRGAFLNGKKIQVSNLSHIDKSIVLIGFPYKKEERFKHLLQLTSRIIQKTFAFRHFGAAALDLAYVAAGRVDAVFFEELTWWDVAAGMLLIQEAGGITSDFEGNPINQDYKTFLGASPVLYKQLRELIASC